MINNKEKMHSEEEEVKISTLTLMISLVVEAVALILEVSKVSSNSNKRRNLDKNSFLEAM